MKLFITSVAAAVAVILLVPATINGAWMLAGGFFLLSGIRLLRMSSPADQDRRSAGNGGAR
jgi:hypothetical protein